jgi:enolase
MPLWKHYAEIAGNPVPYTLPIPCFNVINGGEHAGNKLAFQEFFVIPTGAADFTESMISKYMSSGRVRTSVEGRLDTSCRREWRSAADLDRDDVFSQCALFPLP